MPLKIDANWIEDDDKDILLSCGDTIKRSTVWDISGKMKYLHLFSNIITSNGLCITNGSSIKFNSLLELGCDWGHNFATLEGLSDTVFGIEKEQWCVDTGHDLGRTNIIQGDIDLLPYNDRFFDCVCSAHTLEHSSNIKNLMLGINRVTKSGGWSAHIVPSITNISLQEGRNDFHKSSLNWRGWLKAFEKYGFHIMNYFWMWAGNQEDFSIIAQKDIDYSLYKYGEEL